MSLYVYGAGNPLVLVDADGREVIYGSLRDRINSWFAWLISSDYRKRWRRWKESEDWYLIRRKDDKPVLIEAGASKLSEGLYLVEYSGTGISGSEPIEVNINFGLKMKKTWDYKVKTKRSGNSMKVTTDIHRVRNMVTDIPIEIDPKTYPDIFTFRDKEDNIFFGPYSIVREGELTKGYQDIDYFGKFSLKVPEGRKDFIIEVTSRYPWPGGHSVMPSEGRITYYRYIIPPVRFKFKL